MGKRPKIKQADKNTSSDLFQFTTKPKSGDFVEVSNDNLNWIKLEFFTLSFKYKKYLCWREDNSTTDYYEYCRLLN